MIFDRIGAVAARVLASTRASSASHLAVARTDLLTASASTSSTSRVATSSAPFGARGITVNVERGDAERAYKRLRRIMLSEGIYKDLRASCEGHKKPSQLRVLARKERERRNFRSKINSRLGWIMRRKERGF
jgi:ribosomal protein S21